MKNVIEKVKNVIENKFSTTDEKIIMDIDKILSEMKNAGVIKEPTYTLPMNDTIGKNYYSLINKKKNN